MRVDLLVHPTDQTLPVGQVARMVEEVGFGGMWVPDHSHLPVGASTPRGGREGAGALPGHYARLLEQFVALTAAATATQTIRLGTAVTVVPQRDPIYLAKQVASLDLLSGGRVAFGVGYGWNVEELRHHGVDPGTRRALLREKLLACQALWGDEPASYDGTSVRLAPSLSWPKPVQAPWPPIYLGAAPTPRQLGQVVEVADGWLPIDDGRYSIGDGVAALHATSEAAGRDPATLALGVVCPSLNRRRLEELRDLGASFVVVDLAPGPPDTVERDIEAIAHALGVEPAYDQGDLTCSP